MLVGARAVACAGPGAGTDGTGGGGASVGQRDVALTWQVELQPDHLGRVPAFLAEWTQRYPRIKVEAQHFGGGDGDKVQKMLTLAAAGTPKDVVGKLTYIQPLAAPGGVQPIEPLIKRDRYDISKHNKNWLTTFGTYDGKLYSLPYGMGGSAMVFVYNRAHFQEVGLKEPSPDWKSPWTWEDYRQAAIRLTKREGDTLVRAGAEQIGNTFFSVPLPWGRQWLKDHKTSAADSPEMIEAYTRYLDLIHKDRTTTLSVGAENLGPLHDRFYNGKVSIHYILGSRLPAFTDPAIYKVDWAMAPFPKGTLPSSPTSSGDVDTIQLALANKATLDESWAFVRWLFEKARYAWFTERMPTLTEDASAWAKENFKRVPATARVEVLVNGLALARPNDPMRSHPKAGDISQDVHTPFWNDVRTQKIAVKDALGEARRKLQGIIGV
jgi:ABC-type glycerol-3-phosphate transport system substrate-binding protein